MLQTRPVSTCLSIYQPTNQPLTRTLQSSTLHSPVSSIAQFLLVPRNRLRGSYARESSTTFPPIEMAATTQGTPWHDKPRYKAAHDHIRRLIPTQIQKIQASKNKLKAAKDVRTGNHERQIIQSALRRINSSYSTIRKELERCSYVSPDQCCPPRLTSAIFDYLGQVVAKT